MRWLWGALVAILLGQPAHAWDWATWTHQLVHMDWTSNLRPYAGAGYSRIHHAGYDRDTPLVAEQWENGGKALAGMEITRRLSIEVAYHSLNETPLFPRIAQGGNAIVSGANERAYAVAASTVWFTPPIEIWMVPSHRWYARIGGAYKHITEDTRALGAPVISEDGFVHVIGGGIEFEFTPQFFGRVEYEYISKLGTKRVINVQHTPISGSLGIKF